MADKPEFEPLFDALSAYSPVRGKFYGLDSISCRIGDSEILALHTFVGKTAAASAAGLAAADFKPDIAANVGYSGCLAGFSKGDFVAAESFVECDFDLTPLGFPRGSKGDIFNAVEADKHLLELASLVSGGKTAPMGSGDYFLADPEKKADVMSFYGVRCFDMETGALAWVFRRVGIPFVSVRRMSDTADDVAGDSYHDSAATLGEGLCGAAVALLEVLSRD